MNFNETKLIKGHLKIREFDRETGEDITPVDEDNVITLEGFAEVVSRITKTDTSIDDSWIETIVLGDDIGSGTIFSPEPAVNTLTSTDQSVVYSIPPEDINLTYQTSQTFELTTVLNGTEILDTNFPNDVDMRYTSATIRFANGKTLSYKRFPIRSLSRLVDVQIDWTVTFDECA